MDCDFWIPGLSSKWEFKVNFGSSDDKDALNDFCYHRYQDWTISIHSFCPIILGHGACSNGGIGIATRPFV